MASASERGSLSGSFHPEANMAVSSTFSASDGDAYEVQMGRWSRRLAEPFLDFAGAAHGERVLDLGCGTGRLSFALAARVNVRVICGLDFSDTYIDHARRHNRNPLIEFRVGDACAMPFPDGSFHRVLCQLMLHFAPRAERAVPEMRRVACPGAVVAAAVWDARGGFVSNRMFWDTAATLDQKANTLRAHNYTRPMSRPGELGAAWRAAGLGDVRETMLMIRQDFESFDDFWAPYLGKQGPGADYVGSLAADARERLRNQVRLAYLDGESDGARSYAAIAWAVKGTVPIRTDIA
jgi:SAM-dependent methyltransferase